MTALGFAALAALVVAAPEETVPVRVDAAPLTRCLEQITLATGARFIVAGGVPRELRCRAVDAAPSIDAALHGALDGAGVRWRLRDDGVYVIVPENAPDEASLAPLTIEADEPTDALGGGSGGPLPEPRPRVADLRSETRFDAPELAARPVFRFGGLGRLAPNVYASAESLSIRGVPRDNDYFSGVSVFYDGIDVGTLLLDNDVIDADELASLRYGRGASSFLHGAGTAGGAIYLDTPAPAPEFGGRVTALYGQRSSAALSAAVAGPLGGGVSGRVALSRAEQPRFVRNLTVTAIDGDTDARERAALKLLFEPDALPGLTVAAAGFHIDAETPDRFVARRVSDPPDAIFDEVSYDSTARDWRLDARGAGLRASYRFAGGIELGVHGSDLDVDRAAPEVASDVLLVDLGETEQRRRYGAQAALPFAGAWRLHAQLEAQRVNDTKTRDARALPPGGQSRQVDFLTLAVDSESAALELAYDAGGRWRATAGARRVEEDVVFLTTRERTAFPLEFLEDTRTSYRRTLPVAGVEYDVRDTQRLALRYDRAYRFGGQSAFQFIDVYAPESLETLELQWQSVWLDGRLNASASVFETDWRDRSGIDGTIGALVVEPIETRIRGGELEAELAATDSLDLRLGVGLLDSVYTRGRYAFDNRQFELTGQRANDAPRTTVVAGVTWRGPRGFFASADAYHADPAKSSTFVGIGVPPPREAYTVVDARVGWRGDALTIALAVGNAFDEHYVDRYVDRRSFSRRIGAPRQVDLQVSWTF